MQILDSNYQYFCEFFVAVNFLGFLRGFERVKCSSKESVGKREGVADSPEFRLVDFEPLG